MLHPDKALADRIVAGDERAFEAFFEEYFRRLFRFVLSRAGNDADLAEEVVQATLCRAISKLATYRGEAPLFTWLCTLCRRELSSVFRKLGRQPFSRDLGEDDPEILGALEMLWQAFGEGPLESLERDEIARLVHVALDELSPRHGDALEWKYIEGAPVKEIAERLRLSPKAAESLLTRARLAFKDAFLALLRGAGGERAMETGS